MIIKDQLIKDSGVILKSLGYSPDRLEFEHPADLGHGDYATNVAMVLFKKFEIRNSPSSRAQAKGKFEIRTPLELAEIIANKWREMGLPKYVEKVEVALPGFLNVWLHFNYLVSQTGEVLRDKNNFGGGQTRANQKIMVEFAHPNTHKELHVGHMRTLITGEALARIFTATGAKVFRANYQGDIGPHVAKSIWGTQRILGERKMTWEEAEKMNLTEKAHLLGEGYVKGSQEYEANQKEIDELNNKIYQNDSLVIPIYERSRRWSLSYYDTFYRRFYTKFDRLFFESEVFGPGKKVVEENVGKVFENSEGAIIFDGEKFGLHKRVFVTKEGNATYEGKDMALAPLQYQVFPFDLNLHVVANEQAGYFKVIIKALELLNPKFIGKECHLSMGMVNLIGKKMSSRTGVILKVDDLLEEVKDLLKSLISGENLTKDEKEKIAEVLTIAAVKYSILKVNPEMNVAFDLEKSISLQGDSGPYLEYTHTRTQSVLKKAKSLKLKVESKIKTTPEQPNDEETSLLKTVYRFPEVVEEATKQFAPNLICNFLFDLAQKFNLFYDKHRILGEPEEDFRLALTAAVGQVIKNGLNLLGIEALEKM